MGKSVIMDFFRSHFAFFAFKFDSSMDESGFYGAYVSECRTTRSVPPGPAGQLKAVMALSTVTALDDF